MTPFELRYRDGTTQPENIPTNEFVEGILKRKTMRRFDASKKLPKGLLEYLVAAAQASPTSSSGQSWSVIALETEEEKQRFKSAAGDVLDGTDPGNLASYNECSVFLIWVADNFKIAESIDIIAKKEAPESEPMMPNSIPATHTIYPLKDDNSVLFHSGSHQEWLDQSYYSIRAIMDATIAAQTFSLCAESLGLGTVYMGSIAHCNTNSFVNELNLPARTYPIFGMAVGYPPPGGTDYHGYTRTTEYMKWYNEHPEFEIKPRHSLNIVLHKGRYNKNVREILKKFNRIAIDYYKSVGQKSDYFATKCVQRVKKVQDQLWKMRELYNKWR